MAINKKLIHFKTKQKFNEELAKGNILETSIVFILDTTEIYTHGLLYDGSKVDLSKLEEAISKIKTDGNGFTYLNDKGEYEIPLIIVYSEEELNSITPEIGTRAVVRNIVEGYDNLNLAKILNGEETNVPADMFDALDKYAVKVTSVDTSILFPYLEDDEHTIYELFTLLNNFEEFEIVTNLDGSSILRVSIGSFGAPLTIYDGYDSCWHDNNILERIITIDNIMSITNLGQNVVDAFLLFSTALNVSIIANKEYADYYYTSKGWVLGGYITEQLFYMFLFEISNFITEQMPTRVSQLVNDSNYILDDVISDGVYAVDANGKLIDYNTADSSCLGVALIAGDHLFMIAKEDATNNGSNYNLYYDYNKGNLSLTNYSNADGTNSYGYLGTELSDDFTTWTAGALSDFNGKTNTQVITASSSTAKDMCKVLGTFNAGTNSQSNEGHNDWYVPALGQLALMYLAKTDINAALAKIGGTAFESDGYWSSSEYDADDAWYVFFDNGDVGNDSKNHNGLVRFVRDFLVSKPLKERVSDLETKVKELNAVLVDTEEEADDPENIDEIIQSDWNETDFTSGAYIKNKPTIPSESTVSEWGFTKNTGTYSKPSTGIPKSDLASEVLASLGKADTALQSYTEQYKGTITGVSANGTSVATSGVANIPAASTSKYGVTKLSSATNSTSTSLAATASAVKTAYDLANGRQAKLVSGTNIKTINGNSILGSGNLEIGGSSAYPRVDHGVTNTTFSLSPNTFYVWGEVDTLDLSFAEEQAGVANEYLFQFTSSEEPTTLTLPDTIQWVNEVKIESKKIHQVSVMDNIGIIACPSRVIIRFSVVKTGVTSEYTCELGMTWGEWVNSVYVRDGWHNYQGYITSPDLYQISDIVADDIIESGRIYSTW